MKNVTKKVLTLGIAGMFAFSATAVATASEATVPAGTLNFSSNANEGALTEGSEVTSSVSTLSFGSTTPIDVDGLASLAFVNDYVRIDDNRGTNEGWRVKVSATDLTSTVVDATNTTDISPTAAVTIPIDTVLTVESDFLTTLAGSDTYVYVNPTSKAVTTTGVDVMYANAGYGAGAYKATNAFTLALPKNLPATATVVPSSAENSSLDGESVTDLGLFSSVYSTTITYSISATP